jgi:Cd2+/Zn2+-exporting ATPase
MGVAGSDVAIETADVALMRDDLTELPVAIRLARRTLSIIRQNIAASLLVKLAFILLTFLGVTNLWLAVLADTGMSLLVTFNSLRLAGVLLPSKSNSAPATYPGNASHQQAVPATVD